MTEDELTTESLMKQSKRRLAETVQAQCRQVEQLNRELAVANWQAGLLAAQRDEILKVVNSDTEEGTHPASECPDDRMCYTCRLTDWICDILITDPRDVTHG